MQIEQTQWYVLGQKALVYKMYEGILGVNLVEGVVCIEAVLPFAGVTTQLQATPLCEVSSLNHLWDGTEQVLEVLH